MTPQQFTQYLESLATAYVPMQHSAQNMRFATRELFYFGNAGSALKLAAGPCLIGLEPRYNGVGDNSDNNVTRMAFGFAVMQHYATDMKAADVVVRDNALYLHAVKILGKIKAERLDGNPDLLGLKPHQARIFKAPAYFDNARGWEVQIPLDFDGSVVMEVDPDDWN